MILEPMFLNDLLIKEYAQWRDRYGHQLGPEWDDIAEHISNPIFVMVRFDRGTYVPGLSDSGFIKVPALRNDEGKFVWTERAKSELKVLTDHGAFVQKLEFGNIFFSALSQMVMSKTEVVPESPSDLEILAMFESLVEESFGRLNEVSVPYNVPLIHEDGWAKVYVKHVRDLLAGKYAGANVLPLPVEFQPEPAENPVAGHEKFWTRKTYEVVIDGMPNSTFRVFGTSRPAAMIAHVQDLPEDQHKLWELSAQTYCGQPFTVTRVYGDIPGDVKYQLEVEGFSGGSVIIEGHDQVQALERYVHSLSETQRKHWDLEKRTYAGLPVRIFPVN